MAPEKSATKKAGAAGAARPGMIPGKPDILPPDELAPEQQNAAAGVNEAKSAAAGDQAIHSAVLSGEQPVDADKFFDAAQQESAAPEAGTAPQGGGVGSYTDDAGDLLNGVDRLDMLDPFYWGSQPYEEPRALNPAPRFDPVITLTPAPPGSGGSGGPGDPDVPGGPDVPGAPGYSLSADGIHLTVNEAYLPNGSLSDGSGIQAALSHEAVFIVASNDGLYSVSVNGVSYRVRGGTLENFPSDGIDGCGGRLGNPLVQALADGSYRLGFEFSVSGPYTHSGPEADVTRADNPFEITVTSRNGANSSPISLTVDIIDDVPQAVDDSLPEVAEGGANAYFNVLANDAWGADQPTAKEVIRAEISDGNGGAISLILGMALNITGFGRVTLNADGSLVFEATALDGNANIPGRTVTYWIADADGDESSATLELTRDNKANPVITIDADAANLTVDESALIQNGSGTKTASGEFTVTAEAELDSVSFEVPGAAMPLVVEVGTDGAADIIENGVNYGTFTAKLNADGTVEYSFTLNAALDNDAPLPAFLSHLDGDKGVFTVEATATDKIGQKSSTIFAVTVTDDAPTSSITFSGNYGDLSDGTVKAGSTATGLFAVNRGADARTGEKLVVNGAEITADATEIPITGYGTLTVNRDGSFTFKADPDIDKDHIQVEFTYIDADGDPTTQQLKIGVAKPPLPEDLSLAAAVDEAGLDNTGTNGTAGSEFGLISLPEGWTVTGQGGSTVGYGNIVRTGDGWSFELTHALDHAAGGQKQTSIQPGDKPTVMVKDPDGNTYEVEVTVTVRDDVIEVSDSSATVVWKEGDEELEGMFTHDEKISLANSDKSAGGNTLDASLTGSLSDIGISISAGVVKYDADGNMLLVTGQTVGGVEMNAGSVHINKDGIFVSGSFIDQAASEGGNTPDRFNELNYDRKTNASEAIVIDLDGLAYGVSLELSEFYGGGGKETECGRITYYLKDADGVYREVGYTDFTSNAAGGNYSNSFGTVIGGFDRVVISATHNDISAIGQDNSDFSIKSVKFDTLDDFVRYEKGEAADIIGGIIGADGLLPGSIRFHDSIDGSVLSSSLGEIKLTLSAENHIIGTLDGDKVLEVILTQSTGRWDYAQYKEFTLDGVDGLKFQFQVTDTDGDVGYANILVLDDAASGRALPPLGGEAEDPATLCMMEASATACLLDGWNQDENGGPAANEQHEPEAAASTAALQTAPMAHDDSQNCAPPLQTEEAEAENGHAALDALACALIEQAEDARFDVSIDIDGEPQTIRLDLNELTGFNEGFVGGHTDQPATGGYTEDDNAAMNELIFKLTSSCL